MVGAMSRLPQLGRWWRVVGLVIVGALTLVPARPAAAHAELLATDPVDGSVVEAAPSEVTLQFTERVSVQRDGVRVLDDEGERVDGADASAEGETVVAPVDDLADGSYVVAWRVVSADGHPVHGSFTFSVGQPSELGADVADQAFGSGDDRAYEQVAAVLRMVTYLSVLGVAGFVLVGASMRRDDEPSPVGRATTVASVVGLVAIVAQVVTQAALVSGRGLGALGEDGVLGLALGDGLWLSILVTSLGLLAVIITAGLPFTGAVRKVAMAGAALAPLGLIIYGHTRTMSPLVVGMAADAAHVLAGAVWFGGMLATIAAVRRRRRVEDPFAAAEAVATFSGWAAASVAVVAVAGLVLSWMTVGGLEALTTTTYGKVLLAKVAVAAVVVAAGAWNRFRLVGRVAAAAVEEPPRDDGRGWRLLLRVMVVEAVLLGAVLVLTGVLSNVTPAKAAVASGPVTVSAPLGEGTVDVTVDPATPGRNDVHVYLFDEDGAPSDAYDEAAISLALPAQDLGPFERTPVRAGPGHFQLVGTDLPLAGQWDLTVTVKPDRFTEQTATVTFPVG